MEEPRARVLVEPISVGSLVARFAIAGLVALVFVAAFTAFASRRVGTEQAIDEAKRVAFVSSAGIVTPLLDDDLLTMDRDALDRIDAAVRSSVLRGSRPGQDLDGGRHDPLLRRTPADRRAVRARRRRAGDLHERRAGRRGQRPVRTGEPVRDRFEAARGLPAHRDTVGHAAVVRDVLPLQRRDRRRAPPVGAVRTDHDRRPHPARARADPPAWSMARRLQASQRNANGCSGTPSRPRTPNGAGSRAICTTVSSRS